MNPSQPKNQKPNIVTAVPGPGSQALRKREDAHIAPGLQGYALMAGIAVAEARGSAITDVDGNTYLDFIGGIAVNALGHSHPSYVKALQDQVARVSVGALTSEPRVELCERLTVEDEKVFEQLWRRLGHPDQRGCADRIRSDNSARRVDGHLAADHYFLVLNELEVFIALQAEKVSKPVNGPP